MLKVTTDDAPDPFPLGPLLIVAGVVAGAVTISAVRRRRAGRR